MTDIFRDVRWSWIAFGWFIAAAIASLVLLALASVDIIGGDRPGEGIWVAQALLTGFFLSGFLVGTRAFNRPIFHGVGMGIFSLVAWLLVNLLLGEPTGETTWRALDLLTLAGLLLLQGVSAVLGAWVGARWTRSPNRLT
jgi:hypothetical protein